MSHPTAQQTIASLIEENIKIASDLLSANKDLAYQIEEKEKRAEELLLANKELAYQNKEKEKRAEELLIANKELAYQNKEKEKRAEELVIANKELEQLTYITSHDLQEPLRTIANYMQVFEEDYSDKLDDTALGYIRSVTNATKRLNALVKALLNFTRIGHKKKLVNIGVKNIITNIIADLRILITNSNAIIHVGEMPKLNLYELEFGQLLQNLITNAIKFQKADTQPIIQICSKEVEGKWQFSVSDNGIGIAPIHFTRIFDIFQRLHDTSKYEGSGIGLANCKKIVELHQGKIWIESTLGIGTTIHFTIPNLQL